MKVWLDDVREMPPYFTHHAKTAEEAIALLQTNQVEMISLDHDLGTILTGYDVAKWIEQHAHTLNPIKFKIHTLNPVGAHNIKLALRNAKLIWIKTNNTSEI